MISSSAIYGQAMLHFSEALSPFQYFFQQADFNDNYLPASGTMYRGTDANYQIQLQTDTLPGTYLGFFQNSESKVKDAMGNLVNYIEYLMWAEETFRPGWFVKWDNVTFRIVNANDWTMFAGFTQYTIEKFVGSDGQGTVESNLSGVTSELV
jgi:hypothetical protein